MGFSTRPYTAGYSSSGGSLPPAVRGLLLINVAIFLFGFAARALEFGGLLRWLALTPAWVIERFAVWQLGTYQFLHSPQDPFHILFNMLALWMFGSDLERTWGTRTFLRYYLLCGVGAGVCVMLVAWLTGTMSQPTLGASGAIYGLLLAYGMLFPDRTILLILFPVPAKYFVMIVGAIALFFSVSGNGGGVSHIAHLGGLLAGFLLLPRTRRRGSPSLVGGLRERYRQWKLDRARRKFQVYMRKHDRDRHFH